MLEQFIKSYWNYYLELEHQLLETKRYVEFCISNKRTYSVEYLKLYQAVCSEIDVVGKEIAQWVNAEFKSDEHTNIQKWGYEIQQRFGNIKDMQVLFNGDQSLQPFKGWEYEQYKDKKNRERLRPANKSTNNVIPWWKKYQKVKHQRIGLISQSTNFEHANQENLISAFSALFLLEFVFIDALKQEENNTSIKISNSDLFSIA
ncbi:MAG: hypothetical protein LUG91_00520 [Ruminococcus sp.]|nr:hypothetical protein [Ruminococcus sp.]